MIEPSLPPLPQARQEPRKPASPQSAATPAFIDWLNADPRAMPESDPQTMPAPDAHQTAPLPSRCAAVTPAASPVPPPPPVEAPVPSPEGMDAAWTGTSPPAATGTPAPVAPAPPAQTPPADIARMSQAASVTATVTATVGASVSAGASTLALEFHLRDANGAQEVVVAPWRLVASGHLAQRIDGAGLPTAMAMPTPFAASAASAVADASALDAGAALPTLSAGAARLPVGGVAFAAVAESEDRTRGGGAIEHARRATSPAASEWLARWMKWFERDGRDPTIWLRDFRLDDDQASRVVDDLRSAARELGLSLDRIVVNGRERWRNPQSGQTKE